MKRGWLGRCALLGIVSGCGGGSGNTASIDSGPLSGLIDGKAWTVKTAESNAFLSADGDDFFVDLYAETFEPCTGSAPFDTDSLIMQIPKRVGDYAINLQRSATFYLAASHKNLVATSGRLVVDSVTEATVSASAAFQFDGNNTVNGHFQLSVCPTK